jgi:hypothetical protein
MVSVRWEHSAQWRCRLGKKFVAVQGREAEVVDQRQGLIAFQPMLDVRQQASQRRRFQQAEDPADRVRAGWPRP